ncbi:MAG: hypothetical protein WA002_09575 [Candidatus Acidiferrales bacterium]
MPNRPKAWLAWSSGKDSAWALHTLRRAGEFDVVALLTTINATHARVAMHAVRESLLREQARAAGLSLITVKIPSPCPNDVYERAMAAAMERARAEGVTHVAFGDLFLEDIRRYREDHLANSGIAPVFPIWQRDTSALAQEMLAAGLRAVITCVDPSRLSSEFAGRIWNEDFVASLPEGVDPCGENGEFHSFAFAGPMFREPLRVRVGEIVERDGFVFADVFSEDAMSNSREIADAAPLR